MRQLVTAHVKLGPLAKKDILDSLMGDSRPERLKGREGRSQEQLEF